MKQLLDDLLRLAKIGLFTILPEWISLTELTKEAIDILSSIIDKHNVQIDIPSDLPEIYVDRTKFLQILINLIDNSIKFMGEQTEPRIRIRCNKINGEDVFIVSDNGIGIDSPYLERVFKLFEKMEPKSPGTGIGLTIARRMIDLYGGRIWAESEGLGKGTTFFFTLPVK
jgi:signal transduction histidine kinase